MNYLDADDRMKFITDLRRFTAYLEEHKDLPIPRYLDFELQVHPRSGPDFTNEGERIAEVQRIAGILGVPVAVDSGHHTARLRFGRIVYAAVAIERQTIDEHRALSSYTSNFHLSGGK
ncbi:hypothetical protein [Nonomuraea typhae]|uniref:hypothetical protein n=1 Tax=Nonomuraea typhae TaxID=2603600 RepID=UPI0012FABA9E|nr:hypothetical protein [Nonomuraea typhae]